MACSPSWAILSVITYNAIFILKIIIIIIYKMF